MRIHRIRKGQIGATLMEFMVAMAISLVVTASMVALLSNSLGSTTRVIKMTKLSDDMRVAMQMMTRDLRRSSYNARSMFCYSNDNCASDGALVGVAGDITINAGNNCLTFLTDRDHDGDSTENNAGGFRRVIDNDGVGMIQMWTGDSAPDCADAINTDGWESITNSDNMDIFSFIVDDNLSYTEVILDDGVNTISQKVRKIRMNMRGQLVLDNSIRRRVEDVINVRNDLLL